jgi:hypothetical protein
LRRQFADILNSVPPFECLIDAQGFLDADGIEQSAPVLANIIQCFLGSTQAISEQAEAHAAGGGTELFSLQDFKFGDALRAVTDAVDHFGGGRLPLGACEFSVAAAIGNGHSLNAVLQLSQMSVCLTCFVGNIIQPDSNGRIKVVAETVLHGPPEDAGEGEGGCGEAATERPGGFCTERERSDAEERQQGSDPAHQ